MKFVKYGAAWCGPCKQLDKLIDSLGIVVERVDIDTEEGQAAVAKLGIRSVPVLIKFDGDTVVKQKIGMITESQLIEFVQ